MFKQIHLIIDNGAPIDIRTPRFELFSEQRTVQLPTDNILGVPPQTITVTAYGWNALIRNLRPGPHTIVQDALLGNGNHQTLPYTINIIRHRDSGEGDGDSGPTKEVLLTSWW